MKIAFTSTGNSWNSNIEPRFERTNYFIIYDEETKEISVIDNTAIEEEAHGAGPLTAHKIFEIKPDVLITGNGPGENAAVVLKQIKMKIFVNAHNQTIQQAYDQYKSGKLTEL